MAPLRARARVWSGVVQFHFTKKIIIKYIRSLAKYTIRRVRIIFNVKVTTTNQTHPPIKTNKENRSSKENQLNDAPMSLPSPSFPPI